MTLFGSWTGPIIPGRSSGLVALMVNANYLRLGPENHRGNPAAAGRQPATVAETSTGHHRAGLDPRRPGGIVGTMDGWDGPSGAQTLETVAAALARAEDAGDLGAFWRLDREGATRQAERVQRAADDGLPLAGTPVAVKDLLDVKGLPTTAGVRGDHPAARADAEAVRRLRIAGAVPIGKTAMDPLGCTTGGQAPGFPPCVNPVDERLSPGGSSSGSAVAVAAGVVPLAIGTDTAGSIRVPAAYTGVVGFKPARTAVPRRGCVRVMPGFDAIGVLARSVSECVAGYGALAAGKRAARPRQTAMPHEWGSCLTFSSTPTTRSPPHASGSCRACRARGRGSSRSSSAGGPRDSGSRWRGSSPRSGVSGWTPSPTASAL